MKYKNWKAICDVPDTDFRCALAMLCLATDFGQSVVERLPEYFTEEQQIGPIPLSALWLFVKRNNSWQRFALFLGGSVNSPNYMYPVKHGAIDHFGLPCVCFVGRESTFEELKDKKMYAGRIVLDVGTLFYSSVFKTIEYQGKKWVAVEVTGSEAWFVPAECIALDK